MRIVESEFESTEKNFYDFEGFMLKNLSTEPLFLRHEYYEKEKTLKRTMYLFGRRADEKGTQLFVHKYFNFNNNVIFDKDLGSYKSQQQNFKLSNTEFLKEQLLGQVQGEKHRSEFMTVDGKYRKRIIYEILGEMNSLLLIFSLDSNRFSDNQMFKYIKNNSLIRIE